MSSMTTLDYEREKHLLFYQMLANWWFYGTSVTNELQIMTADVVTDKLIDIVSKNETCY